MLATGSSAAVGCTMVGVRLFTPVFFSVTGAGVASSSAGRVSSATAAGFSLGVSVEISTLGSDVRFVGRCVGVAFTVTEGSKSDGEAPSWARANCDPANAAAVHRRKTQADRILACNARPNTVNGISSQAISPSFLRLAPTWIRSTTNEFVRGNSQMQDHIDRCKVRPFSQCHSHDYSVTLLSFQSLILN